MRPRLASGIALIPFIDEGRLLAAMESIDPSKLTTAERARNTVCGDELIFRYDEKMNAECVPPSSHFAPILNARVSPLA